MYIYRLSIFCAFKEKKFYEEKKCRCFDETSGIQLVECDENAKYCISDLMVDWFAQGEQVATIRRGCAIEPGNF